MRLVIYVSMAAYMFLRPMTYVFASSRISMIIPYRDTLVRIAH